MVTTTEPAQVDAAEVYSRIGRLEGEVSQMGERLSRVEARLDRLIFMQFGMAAGIIAILVKLFLG